MKQTESWFKISTEAELDAGISEIWRRNKRLPVLTRLLHLDQLQSSRQQEITGIGDRDMQKCSGKIIWSLIQKNAVRAT